MTMKISEECIVLIADGKELREQLYQAKPVDKVIKDGGFSVLNGD